MQLFIRTGVCSEEMLSRITNNTRDPAWLQKMKFPDFYVRKYSPTTLDERNRLYTIFVDLRNMDYGREPGI